MLIYQVDVTNWCNATCTYCPYPTHKRTKGFMTLETFGHVLRVMRNDAVTLHHFSEPLLHKKLEAIVSMCKVSDVACGFSTNGKTLTQERLDGLAAAGLTWLRLHTDPFGVRLRDFKVPEGLEMTEHRLLVKNDAPKKEMVSFSGYLDLPGKRISQRGCSYLKDGWRVVLWDGSFALCCHDVEGTNDQSTLCTNCDGYVFKSPRDWGNYDG